MQARVRGNIVACAALFIALGSTSYAATTRLAPPNSVGTRQVVNHSLLARDFRSGLPPGPRGPAGPSGPAGPVGPAGADGVRNWQIVKVAVAASQATAECPAGKRAVAGGFSRSTSGPAQVLESQPTDTGTGWQVAIALQDPSYVVYELDVYAICAAAT